MESENLKLGARCFVVSLFRWRRCFAVSHAWGAEQQKGQPEIWRKNRELGKESWKGDQNMKTTRCMT